MNNFNEIRPSTEQEKCINYDAGDLLVNGLPGAGKSIVLLKRAMKYYKDSNPGEENLIFLTTFNNTLNKYTKDIFQQADIDDKRMSIRTMDSYCGHIYYEHFGRFHTVEHAERPKYVLDALQKHFSIYGKHHRFYDVDPEFWCEEFIWIKQKNIQTLEQYVEAERAGRGSSVRITREERKMVFEFYLAYCQELKRRKLVDFEDIYIKLINEGIDFTPYQFRFVLVDEAQDLSYVKLKVAKMLAKESITIAADKAQKIYNTGFTWKELGIDVRGNASKTLNKTFRSTKQIVQLAESLAEVNRALDNDKSEYTEPVLPTIIGEDYPFVIECKNDALEKNFICNLIKKRLKEELTIGLLYRNYKEGNELKYCLKQAGISYEIITKESNWSLETPGVKLSTLHSSKGLEFDIVIIPFFNSTYYPPANLIEGADDSQVEELKMKERNLLYVGMTRAKTMLYMIYSGSVSPFLAEFNPEYYNYCTQNGNVIEKPINVIQENDTIVAHIEGESKERILHGELVPNPKNWAFIGKTVNDRVTVGMFTYIVDRIMERTSSSKVNVNRKVKSNSTWEDVIKQLTKANRKYAQLLKAADIPVASTIDSELRGFAGDIIAEALFAWEEYKVVYLSAAQMDYYDVWEEKQWKVITYENKPSAEFFKRLAR